jgi:excisionase family DNA binding protein
MDNILSELLAKIDSLNLTLMKIAGKPLTVEEAMKYLDVSESFIYKATYRHLLPYYQPGGKKIYFKIEDLDNYIYKNRIKSHEELENGATNFIQKQKKES